jgi:tetratricopeptide (TPR) repeat protein
LPKSVAALARAAVLGLAFLSVAPAAGAASLAGPYLAAMQADFRNDYVTASRYYGRALAADPNNVGLIQSAVVTNVAAGQIDAALSLANRLDAAMPGNQIAALVRIADAFANEDFERAETLASAVPANELNTLLAGLVSGWVAVGNDAFPLALERFDALRGNEALEAYGKYHKALALAYAGDFVAAEAILAGSDGEPLHPDRSALIAHAEILAQIDRESEAIALLEQTIAGGFPEATLVDLLARLRSGDEVPFSTITRAADGAAAAYLTLALALNTENSDRFGLVYARLAAHVRPELPEGPLLAAEILGRHEQFQLATDALASVPSGSPWYVTSEMRRAATQRAAGDPEAGIETLRALAAAHVGSIEVHSALGDALRVAERFAEAAEAYSDAIALIDTPRPMHWVLYYTRAIAYERSKQWDLAEADFRKALEFEPDQPLVLNYLGYSLVEQRRNLDEALDMIERAVAGQPDDGYITDSLGWVLYRLGRYDEALPHMLRAVELTPADPVINDHLGDVLWMVGRKREAEFQWRRALSLGPADDLDMDRIRRKLEVGLDKVLAEEKTAEIDG